MGESVRRRELLLTIYLKAPSISFCILVRVVLCPILFRSPVRPCTDPFYSLAWKYTTHPIPLMSDHMWCCSTGHPLELMRGLPRFPPVSTFPLERELYQWRRDRSTRALWNPWTRREKWRNETEKAREREREREREKYETILLFISFNIHL